MAIDLPDETKTQLIYSIQRYFEEERDEQIGDLQASFLLDFILKEVGPSVYNQALSDAQSSMQRVVADLDLTLHQAEFGYSGTRPRR